MLRASTRSCNTHSSRCCN
uniref:Uncharacterized protein n=1 Tax=Arundo donax TaxID=35708 RepID=A0A0A9AH67_ARUDO